MLVETVGQLDELMNMGVFAVDPNSLSPEMQRAMDLFENSTRAMQAGNIDEAIKSYKKTLVEFPHFVAPRVNLANCLLATGDYEEALAQLKYAHKFAPTDPEIHINAGRIYEALGKRRNEINQYKQALVDHPDHIPALMNLGAAYRENGDLEKSETHLLSALELVELQESALRRFSGWVHPNHVSILANLALLYEEMGHWPRATLFLRQCAVLNPEPKIQNWLAETEEVAELLLSAGDSTKFAIALLDKGVEHKRRGNLLRAERLYQIAVESNPFNLMGYYSLAKVYYLMNRRSQSISNYLRAAHLQVAELVNGFSDARIRLTIENRLRQQSRDYIAMFGKIHKYAPLLLCNSNVACHLAHALIDLDDGQAAGRGLSSYIAETYRPRLEGKPGQVDDAIEAEHYLPLGYKYLLENLGWERIESQRVWDLYEQLGCTLKHRAVQTCGRM